VTYDTSRLRRSSMIRLASATISSARLFSKLEGLSGKGRFEAGEKIDALQPLPTRLISIRYPLYSIGVTLNGCCAGRVLAGSAPASALFRRLREAAWGGRLWVLGPNAISGGFQRLFGAPASSGLQRRHAACHCQSDDHAPPAQRRFYNTTDRWYAAPWLETEDTFRCKKEPQAKRCLGA
jgi:hypothetical protein